MTRTSLADPPQGAGLIASLYATRIVLPRAAPVAPAAGASETIDGGTLSAVWNPERNSAGGALPTRSRTPVVTFTLICWKSANGLAGVNVAVRPSVPRFQAPATAPVVVPTSRLDEVIVD